MSGAEDHIVTAALLVIGDEILSGRTQDTNTQHIARRLGEHGVRLAEVRVVPDLPNRIIAGVNDLRTAYDYVLTTGGIGPTHDDITAECIAAVFGVVLEDNEEAMQMLRDHYNPRDQVVTEARAKMAKIPAGARLIFNPISGAPGFIIGNVYVMAGVPNIMQAMLENIMEELEGGAVLLSRSVEAGMPESALAIPLGELQRTYPKVSMGSYPSMTDGKWSASIVLRCTDEVMLDKAVEELNAILRALKYP